ncbi:GntR family transcriptional regulator [Hydrogenophaga sp.]
MARKRSEPVSEHPVPTGDALDAGERGPTVERIAQDVASAIVEKRIPPGTWLREEALGRVYAVSRTKVRAALLMLAKDKLVQTIPDKGTFVCQPSVQEAREVFSARRLVESQIVRLFVAKAKRADYERLRQHVRVERSTLKAPALGVVREKLLGDFHVALAEAGGHQVLAEIVTELVARSSLIAMLYQSTNDAHCSTDEHEQFLRICESGQVDDAVANMMEHLHRLEASLDLNQDRPDRQLDLVNALMM